MNNTLSVNIFKNIKAAQYDNRIKPERKKAKMLLGDQDRQ